MTTLYLIRHGESYANVDPGGAVAGMKGDRGLTELGRRQAERLRDRDPGEPNDIQQLFARPHRQL